MWCGQPSLDASCTVCLWCLAMSALTTPSPVHVIICAQAVPHMQAARGAVVCHMWPCGKNMLLPNIQGQRLLTPVVASVTAQLKWLWPLYLLWCVAGP
jgi:hypothetical protein